MQPVWKPYQCSNCDKDFSNNSDLLKHVWTHTWEKLYQCSRCDKTFSDNSNLLWHIRTHTDDKPHKLILSGYNILFTDFLQIFLVFLNNYYGIFFIIGNDFLKPYNWVFIFLKYVIGRFLVDFIVGYWISNYSMLTKIYNIWRLLKHFITFCNQNIV